MGVDLIAGDDLTRLIAPVVSTTSVFLVLINSRIGDIPVPGLLGLSVKTAVEIVLLSSWSMLLIALTHYQAFLLALFSWTRDLIQSGQRCLLYLFIYLFIYYYEIRTQGTI